MRLTRAQEQPFLLSLHEDLSFLLLVSVNRNRCLKSCTLPFPLLSGTSPHAPGNVRVAVSMTSANVSWEPGYDGGYEQTFSVWYGPL